MITFDMEQGSPEWFAIRCGVVTASCFSTVMASGKGNSPSKTRTKYLYQLAGERLTGEVAESYTNCHMERGKIMEEEARNLYCLLNDVDVSQVGFIKSCEDIGMSPDGLIGDNGLLEIKSKLPHLQIEVLLSGKVPPEHMAQIQGGLWVAEREWLDFVSYWPRLPLFVKRVYRDTEYITKIRREVDEFILELNETIERINKIGG